MKMDTRRHQLDWTWHQWGVTASTRQSLCDHCVANHSLQDGMWLDVNYYLM